jgi:hypothetical protein
MKQIIQSYLAQFPPDPKMDENSQREAGIVSHVVLRDMLRTDDQINHLYKRGLAIEEKRQLRLQQRKLENTSFERGGGARNGRVGMHGGAGEGEREMEMEMDVEEGEQDDEGAERDVGMSTRRSSRKSDGMGIGDVGSVGRGSQSTPAVSSSVNGEDGPQTM